MQEKKREQKRGKKLKEKCNLVKRGKETAKRKIAQKPLEWGGASEETSRRSEKKGN